VYDLYNNNNNNNNNNKFVVPAKFVEFEMELILAVERVLLIPSLNRDGAIGPERNWFRAAAELHKADKNY